MNADILKGRWNQVKGSIKETWGELTNDDINIIDGEIDRLIGAVQVRSGRHREKVKQEVEEYVSKLSVDKDV